MKSKRITLNEEQRRQDTSSIAVSSSTINRLVKIFTADRWTRTISFYFFVFCLSIGTSLVERLIFLYFSEDLGASNFLCGLSVLITVAFEIPLFYYSKYIMNRVSLHNMNVIAALAYCVRVVTYTLINSDSQWLLLLRNHCTVSLHFTSYRVFTISHPLLPLDWRRQHKVC